MTAHSEFRSRVPTPLLLCSLIVSFACSTVTGAPSTPEEIATQQVTIAPSPPGEITIQQEMVFGSGPLIFTDTQAGLAGLSSYRSTLTLSFEGTHDGKAENWSKTYVMLAANEAQARQWDIQKTGDYSDVAPVFLAEVDGVDYERHGDDQCHAVAIQEGDSFGDLLEPASFLTGVIGADEAGSETVNDVAAIHYTFDQRALGEDGLTQATGEMWVAAEGGYIVKYLLARTAGADYFGEGIEGTLTLDYELTDINTEIAITLPEDCPPGMVDAPLLLDASNIEKLPGSLSYETSTNIADAAEFYQEELKELGWEPLQDPPTSEAGMILSYSKGDQVMTIILTVSDGKTVVDIIFGRLEQMDFGP